MERLKDKDDISFSGTIPTNEEDLTLLTESILSGTYASKTDQIKEFTVTAKSTQDLFDYEKILGRGEERRRALAIRDILLSKRIPFSTTKQEYLRRKESEHTLLKTIDFQPPPSATTALPPVSQSSSRKNSQSRSSQSSTTSLRGKLKEKKVTPQVSKVKIVTYADIDQSHDKSLDTKLQMVLEILEQAKQDVNSSKLYVKAAKLFYELSFYDRAIYCYQCGTQQNRADVIVDILYLPNTPQFQRKLERMSDRHRQQFLAKREQLRQQLIYEESERQRLRARFSHCRLFHLFALIPEVQNIWSAHESLGASFALCKDDREHIELLQYYHYQIKALSDLMNGKAEFDYDRQMIQAMAGPISEAHLNILLELESLEPTNPEIQDWLGIRYTEKCDFENALQHYKNGRDLRNEKPSMKDALELWKTPVNGESYEDRERKVRIQQNTNKHRFTEYNENEREQEQDIKKKDFTWFQGCHEVANTILYLPPPQGWHVN